MATSDLEQWPTGIHRSDFPTYKPRAMASLDLWVDQEWAIKAYGIQQKQTAPDDPIIAPELVQAAKTHVLGLLHLTREEGSFYKTGFAVLHQGALANWLLFQWWTHEDVWCQFLSYSDTSEPLVFNFSTRPVRACVYETAIIWHEQKSWIEHVLNGNADRRAYLTDFMSSQTC
ncbi:hypothetical protein ACFFUT_05535 [Pseudohalocynthiibacter aestuariivivens]|uniref:Uncharacterized protein n=1 Tax=Pseudohalocynthiibacter aestuariivivens TaxID=1591409 RepID=A0ABV5JDN9_9RHOB|nr:hypothetical protein [Pseudohalocynthiibacter aestuariivivens]MBS9717265.1 hypothetical protein [Pseudohalocynthiibacter aestuariivivens]